MARKLREGLIILLEKVYFRSLVGCDDKIYDGETRSCYCSRDNENCRYYKKRETVKIGKGEYHVCTRGR